MILAAMVGVVFRIYSEFFLIPHSFWIVSYTGFWAEFCAQLMIFICVTVLLCVICKVRRNINEDYNLMMKAFLNTYISEDSEAKKAKLTELKKAFPDYF